MSKEVRLSQISHKTYAIATKHIHGAALTALFQVFKVSVGPCSATPPGGMRL